MKPTTIRRLLRLYPKSWRERYGDEFSALLETHRSSWRSVADVIVGALVAHARAVAGAVRASGANWDARSQDLRYAARGLRRQPGFTLAVVTTLSLGIGVNAAMFGIIDRLLFRPPAMLRDTDRVHRPYFVRTINGKEFFGESIQYRRYQEVTRWTTSFDRTAAVFHPEVAIGVGDEAREMRVAAVSASLFDFFDAKPVIGRYFSEAEDATPSGTPVVVLSYAYWQTKYGGSPRALGEKLHIGPLIFTVIGVAPQAFNGLTAFPTVAYIPITAFAADMLGDRNSTEYFADYSSSWMTMLVRRRPGVSVETATADMTAAFKRSYIAQREMSPNRPSLEVVKPRVVVGPMLRERGPNRGSDVKLATWLGGVTLIVLVIACANVANLLLTRSLGRRREIAVRLALGAGRGRLIMQLLTESVLLATLAGLAGLALAQWGGTALRSFLLPGTGTVPFAGDTRTVLFAGGAALLTGVLVGLVPIAHAMTRRDVTSGLKAGAREGVQSRSRTRSVLLVLQVALSLVLLVGSGLFVRSLRNVESIHLGYDVDPILYVNPELRSETLPAPELAALKRRLLERAQSLPGVASAARVTTVPFFGSSSGPIFVPGLDTAEINKHGEYTRQTASPEYFVTAGTRVIRGRAFTSADVRTSPRVALVTDAMAKTLWPGKEALGQCFKFGDTLPCITVIGVTENVKLETLKSGPALHYYLPIEQRSPSGGGFFVRMRGDARGHTESVRRELQRLMPGTSYVTVTPFADIMDPVSRSWRLGATMFTAFGGLALLLAAIGLYSVIAHGVTARTHELGVRVALGAQTRDVIRLVLVGGLRLGVAGVVVGVSIALVAAKWITPLLFEQSPYDASVFTVVTVMLLVVAASASYLPARRATRVDPNTALRAE